MSVITEKLGQAEGLRKGLRTLVEASIAGICCVAFVFTVLFVLVTLITGKTAGTRDFVVYWATGQQFAQHANPYDSSALLGMERQAGLAAAYGAMYMRNPPWMLSLTFPLAFSSVRTASMLWTLLLLACLGASLHLLWLMHGRPRNRLHLLGFAFAPALLCIMYGQTSILALLGLVLFLRLHAARPFLAGVSLWFCALKPHLFLPFAAVLLAWVLMSKSYRILAGALVALAASSAAVYVIDPMAWVQYAQMMRASGVVGGEFIPCLNLLIRLWLNPHALWLQYLPTALGCIWMLSYYWSHRTNWSWLQQGNLVMLVSVLLAPYAWPFDHVLVIPALLAGLYQTRSRNLLAAIALVNAFIEIAVYLEIRFPSAMYLWTLWAAPAWLAWYLLANRVIAPNFSLYKEESFAH
jgi:Glycosyltransferase family 87